MIGLSMFHSPVLLVWFGSASLSVYFAGIFIVPASHSWPCMCSISGFSIASSPMGNYFARSPHPCSVSCIRWHSVPSCLLMSTCVALFPHPAIISKGPYRLRAMSIGCFLELLQRFYQFPRHPFLRMLFMVPARPCSAL